MKSKKNTHSGARTKRIVTATSQIVREAAELLDEEMAAGIVAARKMQDRFQKERRIDPNDFQDTLNRFKGAAHDLVNAMNDQFTELSNQPNTELVKNFSRNTHDLLDLVAKMVASGATIANEVVQATRAKQHGKNDRARG